MADIKDIYIVRIYYEDKIEKAKNRPIIIINKNVTDKETSYTISEITSAKPKDPPRHFDKFKEPIVKWKEAGLDKMSFVKVNKLYKIPSNKLYKKIGVMTDEDFDKVINRIVKQHF
ncbi:type II toxin-antitoxin system PemK/MazF family toxin [Clostridium botulinum]|uniref:Type II toxin-antitoxin system PemK/MazF family toxin n=2 Tax=Clostridium botulinum TaxID=1491 RepID=A0A9Q1UX68_CLOBO|nr:type II toxin-antitoxin system PemK/MazF family toxin [Clostridium botulinum]AEB77358.1 conserved hypothetical protein [Clostridium botulinum BKT015925]KEH96346.1 hypothetical protein Y848_13790 [Clostridium botulinum C/D str. Sp77]KLU74451.1 hypothetical protein CBC3_p0156 [Clostridium botulinum V891]KOA79524.1 hypothetical protein ADU77_03865 [Clostridium botulinum]KOA85021.1 hypothetical protein ADU74_10145 [Clostridium botulinum]